MKKSREALQTEFQALCKRLNWKFTGQRFAIYEALQENTQHPSADAILSELRENYPAISRDSVYRILNDFVHAGVIVRMEFPGMFRFDANAQRHDHFICDSCHRIFDIAGLLPTAGIRANLCRFGDIRNFELRASGICRECMEKSPDNP